MLHVNFHQTLCTEEEFGFDVILSNKYLCLGISEITVYHSCAGTQVDCLDEILHEAENFIYFI